MIAGLRDGTIDVIHSDHDPQDTEVKRQPFAEASDGAIGLETLLAAALRLVHSGDVPLLTVLRAMTVAARRNPRPAVRAGCAKARRPISSSSIRTFPGSSRKPASAPARATPPSRARACRAP